MNGPILLIEDERLIRIALEDALLVAGYEVKSFDTGAPALDAFRKENFSVVVTDIRLPDVDGFSVLKEIIKIDKSSQVIVMTAYGTIKDAVDAMKMGAFDYITKPVSLDEFLLIIERASDIRNLREENVRLKKDAQKCFSFPNIVGESETMLKMFAIIEMVARTDSSVLLLGESGTGKELVATTIHYQSKRSGRPLIKVNCAALPEGLIESELFGYERGAFTGAIKRKPGRFELADGGTIFLDEIGDLPLSAQSKLLRVLQEQSFERVGGTETLAVNVRVIAATNRDLKEGVKKGSFREDLYYRLNVIPVLVPSLRERKDDIPSLIEFFLEKYERLISRRVRFSEEAMETLLVYGYPGNVRELQNIIERCVTLSASNVIEREELPANILQKVGSGRKPSLSDIVAAAEKEFIIKTLRMTKRNKTKAAATLGISRKTLWEKINAYRIDL